MRAYSVTGMILILLGIVALLVRSVTYFSTDTLVGPLGFFAWDVSRPHTLMISPLAGIIAMGAGMALLYLARHPKGNV